ncbi:exodeoxyribonuclease III [Erysipelothrix rhusiopathiae]|uniref:exodeoxyribonuclease III n=1 Tax=Erysipelothrix rhusiopathiae TaxID=1648 RepID=UPI000F433ABF|nr:exodeoxyribonuclease III [Erysipelothrix rhusiopathiae]AYV33873.1 exodeoxyribonuclease III [Erysipelothrix rhusiopathiae]MDE8081471.1 exodeoxyribonuclease III [Erysipelothrix rhusiopathiae]MDE8117514.1 exodeoxyribonuclease III [Erysipelothrix rhusiopathiae]MDE8201815.1 exodeoxyribonuclease III [Erysipelothrix rhusiopathiae]MDE8267884.1 exodeoxyribonuclease III [Erysipelothrix rhusiopathiae]
MKLISWNVNGLRAVMKKDFEGIFEAMDTDVLCLQETKMQAGQLDYDPEGYYAYYNYAEKKGYSGTAVYTRIKPLNVTYGIQEDEHNTEGRVITCEYDDFFLVCVYTPNSQPELKRIDYRMQWEDDFREYLKMLDETKPVVLCGDLNVAHKEIDLKNPSANRKNPGFSDQEREQFTNLLEAGFIDSFRELHPNAINRYSWWSYRANARSRNTGWRIDYFVVSERLRNAIEAADILDQVFGSDHCPVMIKLNF